MSPSGLLKNVAEGVSVSCRQRKPHGFRYKPVGDIGLHLELRRPVAPPCSTRTALLRASSPLSCDGVDPVTHVLLGGSLGYVAFGRRLGRTAALAGGLAAFAPDADIFIRSATDPLLAIEHHRGFTHALAFAPVGAAVVAALWLSRPAWRSRSRWLELWSCCILAYLSHAMLDAATTYGTQLFWPFSNHRASWDLISIIDPAFTFVLLMGLGFALSRRRVRPALVSLGLCAVYLGFGAVQHERAARAQRQLAASRGHHIERSEMMPTLA